MDSEQAVVWTDGGTERLVGKLTLLEGELILDGTTTTPERRHDRVLIPRIDITAATVERVDETTAIRLVAADRVYLVEPVSGGRGTALSLLEQLTR